MARRREAASADTYIRAAVTRIRRADGAATNVNLAQFRAQRYTNAMVDVLAGIAQDSTASGGLRRACAMDVITVAYGVPKLWAHDGRTIDPTALLPDGTTIDAATEAAEREAELYLQMDELARRKIPPAVWPEELQKFAGETLALYGEEGIVVEKIEDK